MPVGVSKSARKKYAEALADIDRAIVELGEGLRYDTDADAKFVRVALEELHDAARRIRSRMRRDT